MLRQIIFQNTNNPEQHYPDLPVRLAKLYQEQVELNHIQYDEAQFTALQQLQTLLNNVLLYAAYESKTSWQKLISPAPDTCQHLYLYGGVGSGKTMLMDLFYEACPLQQKRRVHFHAFMLEIHEFTHNWRKTNIGDVISSLAKKIRDAALLICFDEFHVTDIADAMILGRLFRKLFEYGVIVVITSNRHPTDLYKNGLQRELFLPFITLLMETSTVLQLSVKKDYRLSHLQELDTTYFFPLNKKSEEFIELSCNELTHYASMTPGSIHVLGRDIDLVSVHGDILRTSFIELCSRPLGVADYLEIACEFSAVIMSGIPKLTPEKRNEAKRFSTLIDSLYEYKVKFICSAEVPAEELYTEGHYTFEFQRTVSRLMEMQSEIYFHNEHVRD